VRSVIFVQFSRPSIFSIKLNERSSHFKFTNWFSPLIFVMILLSSYSLVSFSIPLRLSISTMSKLKVSYYFDLTFVRETKMSQIPDTHILLIKDFVLLVILNHVALDESVIDYSWLHSFSIFLNFTFSLKLVTNMRQHF
jgi:hypothetical protein